MPSKPNVPPKVLRSLSASLTASSPTTFPTTREVVLKSRLSDELATGLSTCTPRIAVLVQLPLASRVETDRSHCYVARMPFAAAPTLAVTTSGAAGIRRVLLRLAHPWQP